MNEARTSDELISPVTTVELSDWASIDLSDPLLEPTLISATAFIIEHLRRDLTPREWVYTVWDWPTIGTMGNGNLSCNNARLQREIELPYANLISDEEVLVYGDVVTDYIAHNDSIVFPNYLPRYYYHNNITPALVVRYIAGYNTVPTMIKTAIKVLATYMFEHRGECDATDALRKSGAREMLVPFVHPSKLVPF